MPCGDLIRTGLVKSAHDCSKAVLPSAMAESCFNLQRIFGAEISLKAGDTPAPIVLFNESTVAIVISVAPEETSRTRWRCCANADVPFKQLGGLAVINYAFK